MTEDAVIIPNDSYKDTIALLNERIPLTGKTPLYLKLDANGDLLVEEASKLEILGIKMHCTECDTDLEINEDMEILTQDPETKLWVMDTSGLMCQCDDEASEHWKITPILIPP
jgi:hypothetical protein